MSQSFDFRAWIKTQTGSYEGDYADADHFHLNTAYARADINFYAIDDMPEIAEFRIINLKDESTKFFLHFETDEQEHAKSLFHEMIEVLDSLKDHQSTRVLLCCTAGLTTSYFAEKLNETAKALELDYVFSAKDVNTVFTEGFSYDAVLVAPQIGFMLKKIRDVLQDQLVMAIPAPIFGTYNAGACVEMVKNALADAKKTVEEKALEHITHHIENNKVVLIIAVMPDANGAWIRYRVYDKGTAVLNEEVIKKTIDIHDITDIIDTQRCTCSGRMDVDAVGIAIPGMINHGRLEILGVHQNFASSYDLQNGEGDAFNIVDYFRKRYDIPVYVDNNVNAAAIGWYGQQDVYHNIVFHSQPVGYKCGGQGIVIDGKLITGTRNSTGEVRFMLNHINGMEEINAVVADPNDMVKIVGASIAMACVYADPEVVCVRSCMTPDMDEIRKELTKYLPENHIPELVRIKDIQECVLLGEMILVLQGMHQETEK